MATAEENHKAIFRVLDSMDAPHGGKLLKLRFESGDTPATCEIKGATLLLASPDGEASCTVRVEAFALFGGRPSDDRLRRTGRVDIHVSEVEGNADNIGPKWSASGPIP
jgi:hypothetical protein